MSELKVRTQLKPCLSRLFSIVQKALGSRSRRCGQTRYIRYWNSEICPVFAATTAQEDWPVLLAEPLAADVFRGTGPASDGKNWPAVPRYVKTIDGGLLTASLNGT